MLVTSKRGANGSRDGASERAASERDQESYKSPSPTRGCEF